MTIISINGPDNIGKTTQINLMVQLANFNCLAPGSICLFDKDWPDLNHGDARTWRLTQCRTERFAELMFRSYVQRNRTVREDKIGLVLLDRGLSLVEATCLATARIRKDLSVGNALKLIARLFDQTQKITHEDYSVLLTFSDDLTESLNQSLMREINPSIQYKMYERELHQIIWDQKMEHRYDLIIYCKDKSIMEVYSELSRQIRSVL